MIENGVERRHLYPIVWDDPLDWVRVAKAPITTKFGEAQQNTQPFWMKFLNFRAIDTKVLVTGYLSYHCPVWMSVLELRW
jgi:hypothetical protein